MIFWYVHYLTPHGEHLVVTVDEDVSCYVAFRVAENIIRPKRTQTRYRGMLMTAVIRKTW